MKKTGGLAKLVGALQGIDARAGTLADRLLAETSGLETEMATTNAIIDTVAKTRADLKAVNQVMMTGDNGGPSGPLPDSPAPPKSSPSPVAPLSPPVVLEPWKPMDSAPKDKSITLRLPGVSDAGELGKWSEMLRHWSVGGNQVYPSMWKD